MNCPYCRHPILALSEKCPSCGMDADGLRRWLGTPPRLERGFNDLAGEIRESDQKRFRRAAERLSNRHAQCDFHWVHARSEPEIPLLLQAFHYFNHAQVCPRTRCGGNNRDALLLTDPARASAALVVGYGLESLLLPGELEDTLASGKSALRGGDFGRAAARIVLAWEQLLDRVLDRLPRTFGLVGPGELQVKLDESLETAVLRRPMEY